MTILKKKSEITFSAKVKKSGSIFGLLVLLFPATGRFHFGLEGIEVEVVLGLLGRRTGLNLVAGVLVGRLERFVPLLFPLDRRLGLERKSKWLSRKAEANASGYFSFIRNVSSNYFVGLALALGTSVNTRWLKWLSDRVGMILEIASSNPIIG